MALFNVRTDGATHYLKKFEQELKGLTYAHESVDVKGRTYYRVQMFGLADKTAANALCAAVKAKGDNCLPVKR